MKCTNIHEGVPGNLLKIIRQIYSSFQAKEIELAFASIEIPLDSNKAQQARRSLLLQIKHKSIVFNTLGLFNINVKLITSHIGTISSIVGFLMKIYELSTKSIRK